MKSKPYIPRPWQLPHLLATPVGGKVLIVERCKHKIEVEGGWIWLITKIGAQVGREVNDAAAMKRLADRFCPLGPVGTVLSIEGVGDFRTTAIDLRRVDTMTEEEAGLWGRPGVRPQEKIRRRRGEWIVTPLNDAKGTWKSDNPGATWGDWAWFITAERVERA